MHKNFQNDVAINVFFRLDEQISFYQSLSHIKVGTLRCISKILYSI